MEQRREGRRRRKRTGRRRRKTKANLGKVTEGERKKNAKKGMITK